MIITAVDEEAGKTSAVYPNPAIHKAMLDLSSFTQLDDVEIQIFDIQGKEIQHLTTTHQREVELDINFLENGVYLLKAVSNGNMIFARFVKQ